MSKLAQTDLLGAISVVVELKPQVFVQLKLADSKAYSELKFELQIQI